MDATVDLVHVELCLIYFTNIFYFVFNATNKTNTAFNSLCIETIYGHIDFLTTYTLKNKYSHFIVNISKYLNII